MEVVGVHHTQPEPIIWSFQPAWDMPARGTTTIGHTIASQPLG